MIRPRNQHSPPIHFRSVCAKGHKRSQLRWTLPSEKWQPQLRPKTWVLDTSNGQTERPHASDSSTPTFSTARRFSLAHGRAMCDRGMTAEQKKKWHHPHIDLFTINLTLTMLSGLQLGLIKFAWCHKGGIRSAAVQPKQEEVFVFPGCIPRKQKWNVETLHCKG